MPILQKNYPSSRMQLLILCLFGLLVTLPGLITMPPLDRDETRFAQASIQMLETGDFINIRFQDQERNKKPAGIYWMQAGSVSLFSSPQARQIWAYRLPSVLGAIIAIIFTWAIGRTLFNDKTGFLAALLLGASPSLMAEATIAKTDAMLLASICAMQFGLAKIFTRTRKIHNTDQKPHSLWPYTLILWGSLAVSLLIKGPIGAMILITTLMMLMAQPGQTSSHKDRLRLLHAVKPVTGILIQLAFVLPWAIAIGIATEGRFFTDSLGRDMLGKVGSVQEFHTGPPGYHSLLLAILLWPASAFLLAAIINTWQQRNKMAIWFLLSWIIPSWIIFELTATKLPHYMLPLFPAIALLVAKAISDVLTEKTLPPAVPFKIGAGLFAAISSGVSTSLIILPSLYRSGGVTLADIMAAALIFTGTMVTTYALWRQRLKLGLLGAIAIPLFSVSLLLQLVLPSLDQLATSPRLSATLEALGRHPIRNETASPVILTGYYEPSAVFLLGTNTILATDGAEIAGALLQYPHATLIIESRQEQIVRPILEQETISLKPLAELDGFNYSKGDEIHLTLYQSDRRP